MEPRIQFTTTADGISIAYATHGEGHPLVVLPPSIPWSNVQMEWQIPEWARFHERLSQRRMAIRYDCRGAGLSERNIDAFDVNLALLDVEAVVDALGFDEFAIIGFLHSAPIAVEYAAKHPDRVSHLLLWCAFTRVEEARANPIAHQAMYALAEADWELFTETMSHQAFGWAESESARRFARYVRESSSPEVTRMAWQANESIDLSDVLPRIQAPTLVMHRNEYPGLAPGTAQRLAAAIPNARLALFEGSSISPYVGDVESVVRAVDEFLGDRDAPPAPHDAGVPSRPSAAGTFATVLFTDLEGSTSTTLRVGDAKAHEIVRAHNVIVRDALRRHGGDEVKHTGDGIMASFTSATRAVECAIAIQQGLAQHNAAHADTPVRVRIGMNAGEPVAEERDLFGTAVQVASRVCTQAEPEQILVPEVVRQLVAGKGFLFADRGESVLRGFEDPVRLYEVRWRDA
jgi:class 3 adenylate cyclase